MQQPNKPISDHQLAATITSLADKHNHKLLFFHSAACSLCRSLQAGPLQQLQGKAGGLQLVPVCCDDQATWAPEMLHYGVDKVPCFVMLDLSGRAIAKTGAPRGLEHMTQSIDCLLNMARRGRGS